MATRHNIAAQTDSTQHPLTSFYEGLGRLAAEEGELFEASKAYGRARFFDRFTAGRRGSRPSVPTASRASRERGPEAHNR